jgi:hypothetical protein
VRAEKEYSHHKSSHADAAKAFTNTHHES